MLAAGLLVPTRQWLCFILYMAIIQRLSRPVFDLWYKRRQEPKDQHVVRKLHLNSD